MIFQMRTLLRRTLLAVAVILSLLSASSFVLPTLIRVNDIGVTLGFYFTQNKLLGIVLSFVVLTAAFCIKWRDKGRFRLGDFRIETMTLVVVVVLTVASSFLISRAIPFISLDNPGFTSADNAFLRDSDFVMGISLNGASRAYPLTMLAWHHIVNNEVNGKPMGMTYCPICNTAIAFESEVEGNVLQFDVVTNYRANLVMVDRQTGSWWQQLTGKAIQGKLSGTALKLIPVDLMTWGAWKELYPDTRVLSRDTGFNHNYDVLPSGGSYTDWQKSDRIFHPLVRITDTRFRARETVLGVQVGDVYKAYPFSNLGELAVINDEVNGEPVLILFDSKSQIASAFSRKVSENILTLEEMTEGGEVLVRDKNSGSVWDFEGRAIADETEGTKLERLKYHNAFWFAWADFHPDTLVYGDPQF
jgi:hypothetical protein